MLTGFSEKLPIKLVLYVLHTCGFFVQLACVARAPIQTGPPTFLLSLQFSRGQNAANSIRTGTLATQVTVQLTGEPNFDQVEAPTCSFH